MTGQNRFGVKQGTAFLFYALGGTYVTYLFLHTAMFACLGAIGVKSPGVFAVTWYMSTIATSWSVSVMCSSTMKIQGIRSIIAVALLSVLPYNCYLVYLWHRDMNLNLFVTLLVNTVAAIVGVKLSQEYIDQKHVDGRCAVLLLASNYIILIGFFVIFWILPLSIYVQYIQG